VKFLPGDIFTPSNSCFQQSYSIGEVGIQLGLNDYFIGALALFHWGTFGIGSSIPIFHHFIIPVFGYSIIPISTFSLLPAP
jgi:hypothetical protein